ncbi:MAG TPA: phosphate acyltransferase PlsX [Alphaproteobacteria bacterium]|nr:phosphate acyltransferase PlsX [Alphaproteobacteria bacterium]
MILTLAVDAMGGDHAPGVIIQGVVTAAQRYPFVQFLLYGDQRTVEPLLAKASTLAGKITFIPCDEIITAETKPSAALRGLPNSSMRQAILAVAEGRAQGVISAGNTGAYMALAKVLLKTMPGIDRPALASLAPTLRGEIIILDLGANVECSSKNLQQFAIMGEIFARYVLHLPKPKVGLMNVGTEDIKGNATVKGAADLIRASSIKNNFYGFIEGDDLARGTVDVVVMDGFTGNVVLKAGEGVMQLSLHYIKEAFRSSWVARLGYLLASPMLKKLSLRLDYRRYNGGIWLGLNGVAIKSHGGADALGFAHAIDLAVDMVTANVNERLLKEFAAEQPHQEVVNR